jgi:hypothetical protein
VTVATPLSTLAASTPFVTLAESVSTAFFAESVVGYDHSEGRVSTVEKERTRMGRE